MAATGTPTTSAPASTGRRPAAPFDRGTKVMTAVVAGAFLVSVVHYTDNTVRYARYTGGKPTPVARWMIPASWVIFTVLAWLGYRAYRRADWGRAAGFLGAYSVSGLISPFHFTTVSPSDFDAFQLTFIVLDTLFGLALLWLAVWIALRRAARPS